MTLQETNAVFDLWFCTFRIIVIATFPVKKVYNSSQITCNTVYIIIYHRVYFISIQSTPNDNAR